MEERELAYKRAQAVMEYWMGRLSKAEAVKLLDVKTIRFWQMSQQAIVGMTVGLLNQPRFRKGVAYTNEQLEKKQLGAKIIELEKVVATQSQLIEILKSMPGCGGVTTKDGNKKRVSAGAQKKDWPKSDQSPARQPKIIESLTSSKHANASVVEEKPREEN